MRLQRKSDQQQLHLKATRSMYVLRNCSADYIGAKSRKDAAACRAMEKVTAVVLVAAAVVAILMGVA
jgi:hypothetical protein